MKNKIDVYIDLLTLYYENAVKRADQAQKIQSATRLHATERALWFAIFRLTSLSFVCGGYQDRMNFLQKGFSREIATYNPEVEVDATKIRVLRAIWKKATPLVY